MPYSGSISVTPLTSHAAAGSDGLARRSKARPASQPAADLRAKPIGPRERYAYPSRNVSTDSSIRRFASTQLMAGGDRFGGVRTVWPPQDGQPELRPGVAATGLLRR